MRAGSFPRAIRDPGRATPRAPRSRGTAPRASRSASPASGTISWAVPPNGAADGNRPPTLTRPHGYGTYLWHVGGTGRFNYKKQKGGDEVDPLCRHEGEVNGERPPTALARGGIWGVLPRHRLHRLGLRAEPGTLVREGNHALGVHDLHARRRDLPRRPGRPRRLRAAVLHPPDPRARPPVRVAESRLRGAAPAAA